jgi:hypothetical protein
MNAFNLLDKKICLNFYAFAQKVENVNSLSSSDIIVVFVLILRCETHVWNCRSVCVDSSVELWAAFLKPSSPASAACSPRPSAPDKYCRSRRGKCDGGFTSKNL